MVSRKQGTRVLPIGFSKSGVNTGIFTLLVVYLNVLFLFTLSPFTFSRDPSLSLINLYQEKFDADSTFWQIPAWDFFTNILLFVPFGFLFVALSSVSQCTRSFRLTFATISTLVLSIAIELCQLFLPRSPSMVDILLNTAGGFIGALVAVFHYASVSEGAQRCWLNIQRGRWLSLLLGTYIMVVLAAYSLPLQPNFINWNVFLPFQIGNEASPNRPWLGKNYKERQIVLLDEKKYLFEKLEESFESKYRWAYLFLALFPVGFLSFLYFSWRWAHLRSAALISAFLGIAVLAVIEGLPVIMVMRDVNIPLLVVGTGVVFLSILTSAVLSKNARVP